MLGGCCNKLITLSEINEFKDNEPILSLTDKVDLNKYEVGYRFFRQGRREDFKLGNIIRFIEVVSDGRMRNVVAVIVKEKK